MNKDTNKTVIKGNNAKKSEKSLFSFELSEIFGEVALSEESDTDNADDNNVDSTVNTQLVDKEKEDDVIQSENVQLDVGDGKDSYEQDELTETTNFDFTQILRSQQEVTQLSEQFFKNQLIEQEAKTNNTKLYTKDIDSLDINHLLSIGEKCTKEVSVSEEEQSSSDDEISEVVEETSELKNVQIVLHDPDLYNRRKSKYRSNELTRLENLRKKVNQLALHKTHLLCLISRGMYINSVINNEELMPFAMSIIPSKRYYPPTVVTKNYLEELLHWFCLKVNVVNKPTKSTKSLLEDLIETFSTNSASSTNTMVYMFVVVSRFLGLQCRLVINLCPLSLKPPKEIVKKKTDNKESDVCSEPDQPPKKKSRSVKTKQSKRNYDKPSTSSKTTESKKGSKKKKVKEAAKRERKVISTDDELTDSNKSPKITNDIWVEIYVEAEKKWLSCDITSNEVDCVKWIYKNCFKPVSYVLAWNNEGRIKDVTRRYVPQWHISLKSRIDSQWWEQALKPWNTLSNKVDLEEEEELEKLVNESAFPKKIGEYKNHPHYALERNLLKFEAIYPRTAVPLGKINGENIYAKVCIAQLHTKEGWLKDGKSLKAGEEPYKVVKARPKREKGSGKVIKDIPLNLYGKWQVEDYIPPTAVDGKVPRNNFGNVEIYKPCMVPKGTVHLQLPGLMRIARSLDIDCAPAVVGWEFRGHGSHPVLDGVVVCEEFKQTLLDAWNRSIDIAAEKSREASRVRALNNWRKFLRALKLRNKLKGKYNFKFVTTTGSTSENDEKKN